MSSAMSRRAWLGSTLGGAALAGIAQAEAPSSSPNAEALQADVCVVGGGSGGVGATLAAARLGASVILVERHQMLGGTSTAAWVHTWEPSRGGGGIPKDLFTAMQADPLACAQSDYAGGEPRQGGSWLTWEPWALQRAASRLLEETGKCQVLYGTTFCGVEMEGLRVATVVCSFAGMPVRIQARIVIDCTADGNVCVAAGCEYRLGEDPKSLFKEPNAPEEASASLNGMTLLYRITDTGKEQPLYFPEGVEKGACGKPAALRTCANGDILVNAVNMIGGNATQLDGLSAVMQRATLLVQEHFYWMQTEREYRNWAIAGVAPEIGVRETRRIMGEYVLNERDCQAGVKNQEHADIVAITDHAVDIHGAKHMLYEVPNGAYGIPYRCLLPRNTENLMIACRGASFSHIAASSCRLSRTMITLGQAAGTAAALCARENTSLRTLDTAALCQELSRQGVELA